MKLTITIDGKSYELDVEVEEEVVQPASYVLPQPMPAHLSVPSAPPPFAAPPARGDTDGARVSRSPIAGVVVRVVVQPGQRLEENDLLLVLEAMKMETNVTATTSGTVRSVLVQAGDAVSAGQVLVEFEG